MRFARQLDSRLFMPIPYAEPGALWSRAVSRIAAFGQGAAPSQQYAGTSAHTNPHDVVLTGSDLFITSSSIIFGQFDFAMVSVMLNGEITNGLSGNMHSTVDVSGGVGSPIGEVVSSFGAGSNNLQSYYFSFAPGAAGVFTFTLFAHVTGDANVTIPAKLGHLIVQRISANQ